MRDLRSYVVRVYRQHAGGVDGTVQEVRTGRTAPFRTMEELWQAVREPPRSAARASRRRSQPQVFSEGPDSGESDPGGDNDEKQC